LANQLLPPEVLALLRCPRCHAAIEAGPGVYRCLSAACAHSYPVVAGIPVLIDESRSVFRHRDFTERRETTFRSSDRLLKDTFARLMPRISRNVKAARNYAIFSRAVLEGRARARVLVVGGGVLGKGMEVLANHPSIELVETDVALAPRTRLICDGHDLPFVDGSFDGVIVQAVLEHVLDPYRCVAELHRVLAPDGVVFAETPFMQQVHMGPFEFTRFTHSGHRRLFRHFSEIESGASCGPGMALAWAWQYFLLSFARRPLSRALARGFAALTAFPLKYFDYWLTDRPGALDAASGLYFIGRRSDTAVPDREIIRGYRGAM
jgi:SAM-dependent methyltransferase